jgi:hypothetical protein
MQALVIITQQMQILPKSPHIKIKIYIRLIIIVNDNPFFLGPKCLSKISSSVSLIVILLLMVITVLIVSVAVAFLSLTFAVDLKSLGTFDETFEIKININKLSKIENFMFVSIFKKNKDVLIKNINL